MKNNKIFKPVLFLCLVMVCKDCHNFKVFGKKCWFYWENKSACSQFRSSADEEPKFKSVED
ncbi:hypothetical protein DRJ25_04400 [Candidatus Woesearchaeota archaeon]|nr:MAG: hypothetical protein DRJ25_04400 [Candidatus Woesearchaeota archaeon]